MNEAAVKSLVKGLGSARIKLASWDFSVATDGASTYFTIDPMPNWSILDHFQDDGEVFEKAMPKVWAAFRRDVRSVRERETDFFIQTQPVVGGGVRPFGAGCATPTNTLMGSANCQPHNNPT
jgi:hypothetical protein